MIRQLYLNYTIINNQNYKKVSEKIEFFFINITLAFITKEKGYLF